MAGGTRTAVALVAVVALGLVALFLLRDDPAASGSAPGPRRVTASPDGGGAGECGEAAAMLGAYEGPSRNLTVAVDGRLSLVLHGLDAGTCSARATLRWDGGLVGDAELSGAPAPGGRSELSGTFTYAGDDYDMTITFVRVDADTLDGDYRFRGRPGGPGREEDGVFTVTRRPPDLRG